jgi:hypothetical protein
MLSTPFSGATAGGGAPRQHPRVPHATTVNQTGGTCRVDVAKARGHHGRAAHTPHQRRRMHDPLAFAPCGSSILARDDVVCQPASPHTRSGGASSVTTRHTTRAARTRTHPLSGAAASPNSAFASSTSSWATSFERSKPNNFGYVVLSTASSLPAVLPSSSEEASMSKMSSAT